MGFYYIHCPCMQCKSQGEVNEKAWGDRRGIKYSLREQLTKTRGQEKRRKTRWKSHLQSLISSQAVYKKDYFLSGEIKRICLLLRRVSVTGWLHHVFIFVIFVIFPGLFHLSSSFSSTYFRSLLSLSW